MMNISFVPSIYIHRSIILSFIGKKKYACQFFSLQKIFFCDFRFSFLQESSFWRPGSGLFSLTVKIHHLNHHAFRFVCLGFFFLSFFLFVTIKSVLLRVLCINAEALLQDSFQQKENRQLFLARLHYINASGLILKTSQEDSFNKSKENNSFTSALM